MFIMTADLHIWFTSHKMHVCICFLHLSSGNMQHKCNTLKVISYKIFSLTRIDTKVFEEMSSC